MEDEMVIDHQQLGGHESEQTLGHSDTEAWHVAVHGAAKHLTHMTIIWVGDPSEEME